MTEQITEYQDKYVDDLKEIEKLYVDLSITQISPEELNNKINEVLTNLNKVSRFIIKATLINGAAKAKLKSIAFIKDSAFNKMLTNEEILKLRSAELRTAKSKVAIIKEEKDFMMCQKEVIAADAYLNAVKSVYDTLSTTATGLKEQIKLFQNMLYADAASK